jgi:hypothetical protein
MKAKIHVEHGNLVCICGSTQDMDGFTSYDPLGRDIEPDFHPEFIDLVVCTWCRRIINYRLLKVVGRSIEF